MYGLFSVCGIELEYMIVSKDGLGVLPVSDQLLKAAAGEITQCFEHGAVGWSNELVLHVIELKTNGPAKEISGLDTQFAENIAKINAILSGSGGMLMPTAMHPFMNPDTDMHLWNHGDKEIYETYNRIFNCKGHGWSNLQSTHINLPFATDEEFGRLHAAIRVLLPLIPALAASSPFREGEHTGWLDTRIITYRNNQKKIPFITGQVIPEPCFSWEAYEKGILEPMYRDIAPYDPECILQEEWLNSRGAIARFDRRAIEIRLMDIQECPKADMAAVSLITETLKKLISGGWSTYSSQKEADQAFLVDLMNKCAKDARNVDIENPAYLSLLNIEGKVTAAELLLELAERMPENAPYKAEAVKLCSIDSLAERIMSQTGNRPSVGRLREVYGELAECLAENRFFQP
ncbi:glutamate--cysteine ligase [Geovibrio thiophilus]|uniref:Glutamate--cysteine ligase n=1 Tax=Geovibrio thiophilus TaxID=139438 RepID=A0A3R6AX56_9BACT|nr:glutamate-cysteine ligase family protein [Geovibrio thiophilus]QAR32507.1 glutamate--cysteine ligase [Geovibrio thiophilus]